MDEGTLTKTKEMLDDMHKRKIDMADEIFVINVNGYVGQSTKSEIEVDTVAEERRKGLATIACAALILCCLEENLYPSWDAQNMNSVHLAEKLGYEFDHEYTAYEVDRGR